MHIDDFLNKFDFDIIDPGIIGEKKSCVIVGNSSNVLSNKNGKFIDSLDCIIRFNHAKVEGFEDYVGSRTDIRFINVHTIASAKKFLNGEADERKDIFTGWTDDYIFNLKNQILVNRHPCFIDNIIYSRLEENNTFLHTINSHITSLESPSHPFTTGFIGLLVALRFFNDIYFTGYDFYQKEDLEKNAHYFEVVYDNDRECHDLMLEKSVFEYLEKIERIKRL